MKIPFKFFNTPSHLQDKIETPSLALNSITYFLLFPTHTPFHTCRSFSWFSNNQSKQTNKQKTTSLSSTVPHLELEIPLLQIFPDKWLIFEDSA